MRTRSKRSSRKEKNEVVINACRDLNLIKKDRGSAVLIVILLVSFLIRVSLIDDSSYRGHPGLLFRPAEELVREGRLPMEFSFIGDTGAQLGPILVYLFSIFLFIWNDIYTLYLFSIALWCIAAFFVYKMGREFFSVHTGLIASIFVSFHALSLFATTDNSEAIFAAPFIAMFIYSLFQIKFKEDTRYWILCLSSLGFLLQIHASVFSCVFILVAFLFFRPKLDLRYISLGIFVLIILFLPYLIRLLKTDFHDIRMIYSSQQFTSAKKQYSLGGSYPKLNITDDIVKKGNLIFTELSLISLLYIISFPIYNYFRRKNMEKSSRYGLLLLVFVLSYVWLGFFPYINFYSLTFIFIVSCLMNAEFINSLIRLSPKRKWLAASICLLLLFWTISNIIWVGDFLQEQKVHNGVYFKLERQVAGAILKHTPKERRNMTEVEYNNFYSNHTHPDILPNLLYYNRVFAGEVTKHLLEKEIWYPPDRNKNYLIIPKDKLPFREVKAEFSEEIGDYVLINFDSEVNKTCKFSTSYEPDWFLEEFNDSNWGTTEMPIRFCKVTCHICTGSLIDDEIPRDDFFIRLESTPIEDISNRCMLITGHTKLFIMEIYINGYKVYNTSCTDPDKFNRTYEIVDIQKYLKPRKNIIGIHLKQNLDENNEIYIFMLREKE